MNNLPQEPKQLFELEDIIGKTIAGSVYTVRDELTIGFTDKSFIVIDADSYVISVCQYPIYDHDTRLVDVNVLTQGDSDTFKFLYEIEREMERQEILKNNQIRKEKEEQEEYEKLKVRFFELKAKYGE